jgi:hypothetical protein
LKREQELIDDGWEKRFTGCEPRLSEVAGLYEEIGFEVLLEPLPPKEESEAEICEASDCTACFDVDRERYRIIFTRQKPV